MGGRADGTLDEADEVVPMELRDGLRQLKRRETAGNGGTREATADVVRSSRSAECTRGLGSRGVRRTCLHLLPTHRTPWGSPLAYRPRSTQAVINWS